MIIRCYDNKKGKKASIVSSLGVNVINPQFLSFVDTNVHRMKHAWISLFAIAEGKKALYVNEQTTKKKSSINFVSIPYMCTYFFLMGLCEGKFR